MNVLPVVTMFYVFCAIHIQPCDGACSINDLFFSQVQVDNGAHNDFIQIYNPTDSSIALSGYFLGGCDTGEYNAEYNKVLCAQDGVFNIQMEFADGATIASGGTYTVCGEHMGKTYSSSTTVDVTASTACSGSLGERATAAASATFMEYSRDDFRALAKKTTGNDFEVLDQVGSLGVLWPRPGSAPTPGPDPRHRPQAPTRILRPRHPDFHRAHALTLTTSAVPS